MDYFLEVRLTYWSLVLMHEEILIVAIVYSAAINLILLMVLVRVFWDVRMGLKANMYLYTMICVLVLFVTSVVRMLLDGKTDNHRRSSVCAVVRAVTWMATWDDGVQATQWCKLP